MLGWYWTCSYWKINESVHLYIFPSPIVLVLLYLFRIRIRLFYIKLFALMIAAINVYFMYVYVCVSCSILKSSEIKWKESIKSIQRKQQSQGKHFVAFWIECKKKKWEYPSVIKTAHKCLQTALKAMILTLAVSVVDEWTEASMTLHLNHLRGNRLTACKYSVEPCFS